MPLLALDTSADISVSVVSDDGTTLAGRRVAGSRHHAELLAPLVVGVLAAAGVDRRELTGVVAGTGPAPFTGLRAGLVTARTLAFALGIPVHGVCSLDALAVQAGAAGLLPQPDAEVVVVSDARRREVYTARYRGALDPVATELVEGPDVLRPDDLASRLADRPATVVGPGLLLYPALSAPGPPGGPGAQAADLRLDPAVLARIALHRLAAGLALPTEPLYLRRPDVTPAAGAKRATG